jgi:beta-mannosidase
MTTLDLHQGWTLAPATLADGAPTRGFDSAIPAVVPGCVHTDLLAAGVIPEPYHGTNWQETAWIGESDWTYRCHFTVPPDFLAHDRLELVCEGLDTVATLTLNGTEIGRAEDMHLPYRFAIGDHVRLGENELAIVFHSPIRYADAQQARLGELPHMTLSIAGHYNFIRKMACNFGWDWGPALTTSGIWRPIRLQGWSTARLEGVRPLVTCADETQARVEVHLALARTTDEPVQVEITLTDPDGETVAMASMTVAGETACLPLEIAQPKRWWPRGYGEQPLYCLQVRLTAGEVEMDRWARHIGLRTCALRTEEDPAGREFVLLVNDRPIFCQGVNWIPDDCFPHRVNAARYRRRLDQAADAGVNLARVWGGGLFEDDAFYDACDELGLLVWQDFLFACAAYPEEEPFRSLVEREARANLTRLAPHPSLVLLNGGNECIWIEYRWQQQHGTTRTWGLGYYLDLLPRLVEELLPTCPYWPNSPYSGSMDLHPYEDAFGNQHQWVRWHGGLLGHESYREFRPRFVAEFGQQAPPTYATLAAVLSPEELALDSVAFQARDRAPNGIDQWLQTPLRTWTELPEEFDAWWYLAQVNQARSVTTAIEYYRALQPHCMGAVLWQLNDCWPVISWAMIDGGERQKPLWYAVRRAFAPRMLTLQPMEGGTWMLYACNDTDEPWAGEAILRRMTFDGSVLASTRMPLVVPPRSAQRVGPVCQSLCVPEDNRRELVVAQAGAARTYGFFAPDKELVYPVPQFQAALTRLEAGRLELVLTVGTLLRDLCLFPNRLAAEATVSDQLLTVLPGETVRVQVTLPGEIALAALTRPPVLWCMNQVGARRAGQTLAMKA